jgi:hypothetical protein
LCRRGNLAERAEGKHADAKLFERRNDLVRGLARPERVFALRRRGWLHGVGAANGFRAGLRQAEEANLALLDQVFATPATSSIGISGSTRCC